jgi:hypothetical protein
MRQHAIDAMTDGNSLLFWLDVDIARTRGDATREELVYQMADGRSTRIVHAWQRRRRLGTVVEMLNVDHGFRRVRRTVRTVEIFDAFSDGVRVGEGKADAPSRGEGERSFAVDVERIGRRDHELVLCRRERNDVKSTRPSLWDETDGVRGNAR